MSSGNQYQPPGAPIERPQDRPRFGIRWRALFAGAAVDFALSLAAPVALAFTAVASGAPLDVPVNALWVSGLASSAAGGYVAGRVAGFGHVRHGALAVLLLIVLTLPLTWLDPAPHRPQWLRATGLLLSPGFGALGGWLASRR